MSKRARLGLLLLFRDLKQQLEQEGNNAPSNSMPHHDSGSTIRCCLRPLTTWHRSSSPIRLLRLWIRWHSRCHIRVRFLSHIISSRCIITHHNRSPIEIGLIRHRRTGLSGTSDLRGLGPNHLRIVAADFSRRASVLIAPIESFQCPRIHRFVSHVTAVAHVQVLACIATAEVGIVFKEARIDVGGCDLGQGFVPLYDGHVGGGEGGIETVRVVQGNYVFSSEVKALRDWLLPKAQRTARRSSRESKDLLIFFL